MLNIKDFYEKPDRSIEENLTNVEQIFKKLL